MKVNIVIDTENERFNSIEVNYKPDEDKSTALSIAQNACNELFTDYKKYYKIYGDG